MELGAITRGTGPKVSLSRRATTTQRARMSATARPASEGGGVSESPLGGAEKAACIYLDWNATTPIVSVHIHPGHRARPRYPADPVASRSLFRLSCRRSGQYEEVADEMRPYLTHFGNPSSSHAYGRPSKAAVKYGRDRVAKLMGCSSSEVFFVGSGSEADNWAIASAIKRGKASCTGRPHVVTSNIEHPAILEALRAYQADGLCDFTLVEVDGEGTVCPSAVERAVTENTVLVTIMHSNNEVGAVQDLAAIAKAAKRAKRDVLVHTDAAQSFGKVCVNVKELGVDLCTLVG